MLKLNVKTKSRLHVKILKTIKSNNKELNLNETYKDFILI